MGDNNPPPQLPDKHAADLIGDAEWAKAKMLNVKGNVSDKDKTLLHSVLVDEGYLLVASHVDEQMKDKILEFQYIDFARLLPRDRIVTDDDQRLTFINKGGVPYLVPANDIPSGIHGYGKWDQAFRVYSDIIMSKFPGKAQELIQYNHVIHIASQTYTWDNVYMYDKDFCMHISYNPSRSWAVILQQAWSIRLKDHQQISHSKSGNASHTLGSKSKDYCRRFQCGQCNMGMACKYEYKCTICGKFSHRAHICQHQFDHFPDNRNDKFH